MKYPFGIPAGQPFCGDCGIPGEKGKAYRMELFSETDAADYSAFAAALSEEGYVLEAVKDTPVLRALSAKKADENYYLYYAGNRKEVRVIRDASASASASRFSCRYEKKPGDTTALYQYGLVMDRYGVDIGETYSDADFIPPELRGTLNTSAGNCGMLYFFKTADDSILLIDGASHMEMSDEAAAHLDAFLHEITRTPAGEKVRICAWLITHPHADHFGGISRFLRTYGDGYEIERLCSAFVSGDRCYDNLSAFLEKKFPDLIYHRLHTGEALRLADIDLEILYTGEDLVDAKTALLPMHPIDVNAQSCTVKFTFDGISFLLTGDINDRAENILMQIAEPEELKCDVLQVSHHGWNDIYRVYAAASPKMSLYPQSSGGALYGLDNAARHRAFLIGVTEGGEKSLSYAGDETVGIAAKDGRPEIVFREKVYGTPYDGVWTDTDPLTVG